MASYLRQKTALLRVRVKGGCQRALGIFFIILVHFHNLVHLIGVQLCELFKAAVDEMQGEGVECFLDVNWGQISRQ